MNLSQNNLHKNYLILWQNNRKLNLMILQEQCIYKNPTKVNMLNSKSSILKIDCICYLNLKSISLVNYHHEQYIYFIYLYKSMKFQFCGNLSCPEWFLAESSILTKITAVKLKLIVNYIINYLLQGTDITQKAYKLLDGSGFNISQMNAIISTLEFVLRNSIMFNVSDVVLNKQLLDLGLPRENIQSITKGYKASRQKLIQKFSKDFPKLSNDPKFEYTINEFVQSSKMSRDYFKDNVPNRFSQISMKYRTINNNYQTCEFILTQNRLTELINELQKAATIIASIEQNLQQ